MGNGHANLFQGGLGKDTATGGAGRDLYDLNAAAESGVGTANRDVITDFAHLGDEASAPAPIGPTSRHSAASCMPRPGRWRRPKPPGRKAELASLRRRGATEGKPGRSADTAEGTQPPSLGHAPGPSPPPTPRAPARLARGLRPRVPSARVPAAPAVVAGARECR